MKGGLTVYVLGFIVTLCVVFIESSAYSSLRTRPRSTRGFKNAALSTARGFGKRDGIIHNSDSVMDLPFDSKMTKTENEEYQKTFTNSEKFSIDWFIEELAKNPRLARIINKKYIDKNNGDELSSEELLQNIDY